MKRRIARRKIARRQESAQPVLFPRGDPVLVKLPYKKETDEGIPVPREIAMYVLDLVQENMALTTRLKKDEDPIGPGGYYGYPKFERFDG